MKSEVKYNCNDYHHFSHRTWLLILISRLWNKMFPQNKDFKLMNNAHYRTLFRFIQENVNEYIGFLGLICVIFVECGQNLMTYPMNSGQNCFCIVVWLCGLIRSVLVDVSKNMTIFNLCFVIVYWFFRLIFF